MFNYILPSIFDAVVIFLLVLMIFKIFRIKDPATRFAFLFLPLLKPFIVLLDNTSTVAQGQNSSGPESGLGIRMPDPLGFITAPSTEIGTLIYDHSTLVVATLTALIIIFALLATRWIQLFLFLNKFKKEEPLSKSEHPQLYDIINGLVAKFKVKHPKLMLTKNFHFVPFSIGRRVPIIVLSEDLINTFPKEQLEIMLAHELAHIRREDNLTGWVALILRDIMFFNPLAHLVYRMLGEEKEKACDRVALEKTGISPKVMANTLLDVAFFYKKARPPQKLLRPVLAKGLLHNRSTLEQRIKSIAEPITGGKPSKVRTSLKASLFIFLLYIQITLTTNIGGQVLFLR
ncbi:MAG: M56 family metallopeptidase [Actinobacteria bacterium]|nr:M56 family metallopeptidase [Actinomycetota bacterium]